MGAYNDLVVEAICPACGRPAVIRCQIHVGATSHVKSRGRFAFHDYQLGQQLQWWPPGHPRFEKWREDPDRANDDGSVDECSYACCESCKADLYVGVRFRDLTPKDLLNISLEPIMHFQ